MTDEPPTPDRGIGLTASVAPRRSSRDGPARPTRSCPAAGGGGRLLVVVVAIGRSWSLIARGHGRLLGRSGAAPDHNRQRAQAFLAAWSAGDTATMQAMVTPSANVAADLKAVDAQLHRDQGDATPSTGTTQGRRPHDRLVHRRTTSSPGYRHLDLPELVRAGARPRRTRPSCGAGRSSTPASDPTTCSTAPAPGRPRAAILGHRRPGPGRSTIDIVTIGVEPRRMTDQAALAKALHGHAARSTPRRSTPTWHAPGVRPDVVRPDPHRVPRPPTWSAKPIIYPIPGLEFQSRKGYAERLDRLRRGAAGHGGADHRRAAHARWARPTKRATRWASTGSKPPTSARWPASPSIEIRVIDPTIADPAHAGRGHRAPRCRAGRRCRCAPPSTSAIQQAADTALAGGRPNRRRWWPSTASGNVRAVVSGRSTNAVRPGPRSATYPPGSTFKVITTDGAARPPG